MPTSMCVNMLNLTLRYKGHYINAGSFGRGSGTIFVDKLSCNGTEKHINNCTYEISNYCTHYDDVAVLCTGSEIFTISELKSKIIPFTYTRIIYMGVLKMFLNILDEVVDWYSFDKENKV